MCHDMALQSNGLDKYQNILKMNCVKLEFFKHFSIYLIDNFLFCAASLTALFKHVEIGMELVREKVICFLKDKVNVSQSSGPLLQIFFAL